MTITGNIGTTTLEEIQVLAGLGPFVQVQAALQAALGDLDPGRVLARDANNEAVPFDAEQALAVGAGDGAEKTFTGSFGGAVEPGSVSVTDGVEAFSDDGFGNLTGDAGGTGKINYQTGAFEATFNAAPALDAPVSAGYKPALWGVLVKPAPDNAGICEVVIFGSVNRKILKVGEAEPTTAQLQKLEERRIWPVG